MIHNKENKKRAFRILGLEKPDWNLENKDTKGQMETDDPGVKTSDWKEMCDKGQNTMQGHCQEIESRIRRNLLQNPPLC
jgi:hypothetical protein